MPGLTTNAAEQAAIPDNRGERSAQCPSLTIVIPALNEEESIASTIERCVAARPWIQQEGRVGDVEIVAVNDGSTDRTSELMHEAARTHGCVRVIDFEKNRGYGAAIKEAFRQGQGDLVSFLDADGTCDPRMFGEMCRRLQDEHASIALGSRLGPDSQMPRIRRLGNRIFALLLGALSGRSVTDTASGMRVIRRDALPELYPLPDGLQFTPAMSARAVFANMKILEINMPYAERVGDSKLHVLRDGIRFLVAILSALMVFRPNRLFNLAAAVCIAVAVAWGLYPLEFYLRESHLEDWMIYRFLLCTFLLLCAFVFLAAGVLADQILGLVYQRRSRSFFDDLLGLLFSPRVMIGAAALAACGSLALIWGGLVEYVGTGHTSLHWSRAIVAIFLMQIAISGLVSAVLQGTLRLWKSQGPLASR